MIATVPTSITTHFTTYRRRARPLRVVLGMMLVIGPHPTSHAGDDITMQTLVTRVVRGLALLECVAAWACGEVQEGQSEKEMNGGGARDYRVRKRVWDVRAGACLVMMYVL